MKIDVKKKSKNKIKKFKKLKEQKNGKVKN